MNMKSCAKCSQTKEVTEFFRDKSRKDGLSYTCKPCRVSERRGKRKESSARYYAKNLEKITQRDKSYRIANKEKISQRNMAYRVKRYASDPKFRAIVNARARIGNFLKNREKFSKSLGCTFPIFCKHIESQFQPGMTWDNYGKWHIDHKFPLSVAYGQGPEVFAKSCHYSNLGPLWAQDNLRKSDKVLTVNLNTEPLRVEG